MTGHWLVGLVVGEKESDVKRFEHVVSGGNHVYCVVAYVLGYTHVAVQLKSIITTLTITAVNITFATITLSSQTAPKAGSSNINRNRRNSSLNAPTPSSNYCTHEQPRCNWIDLFTSVPIVAVPCCDRGHRPLQIVAIAPQI